MATDRRFYLIAIQVILWGVFLAVPYLMIPHTSPDINRELLNSRESQPHYVDYLFLYSFSLNACLIIFFYIHNYFLFDFFILRGKTADYIIYLLIILLSFTVIFEVSTLVRNWLLSTFSLFERPIETRDVVRSGTWFFMVLFAAIGIRLTELWRQAERRAREIENEHLRTELSFLHMQINPHFLFNSLNTIYGMSLKKSDNAPKAVMKLSQLLRYMVEETGHDQVPIEKEVAYLYDYIELQKMRSGPFLTVTFKVDGNLHSAKIAPMLLMPFVENAFKYGLSNSMESPISIGLIISASQIRFSVCNRKFNNIERHSSGIGIANVVRRLELLYPDRHELSIKEEAEAYSVTLNIPLT